jgi:hypothetical protein
MHAPAKAQAAIPAIRLLARVVLISVILRLISLLLVRGSISPKNCQSCRARLPVANSAATVARNRNVEKMAEILFLLPLITYRLHTELSVQTFS